MRTAFISAALAATTLVAVPATAQQNQRQADREYRDNVRDAQRDYREDVRNARQEHRRDTRDVANRDWRTYRNYDYNRLPPGQQNYYANQYYRDGRYYQERTLSRNDRIYRGDNGRYYCRRKDGTTGLIVGGLAGGVLGNMIDGGRSSLLGTLVGAGGGALLGRSIDRGNVRCR